LEREDVQERLVQALQAQENYDNKIDVSRNMRSKSKKEKRRTGSGKSFGNEGGGSKRSMTRRG
jgi:hypothetical protein